MFTGEPIKFSFYVKIELYLLIIQQYIIQDVSKQWSVRLTNASIIFYYNK